MPDGAFTARAAADGSGPIVDRASLLGAVRLRAERDLLPLVATIDHDGFYPAAILRGFGEDGAFGAHMASYSRLGGRYLGTAVEAMGAIGATCMSTAFCCWCQDTCGWYLENTENTALRDRLQGGIAQGAVMGGTGLSNPMKALAGIETFKLRATRAAGGYVVSGTLPWVSNLGDGHWFGTVFEDADDASHRIMGMVQCGQPGVEIRQNAHFVALEGTGTYSVLFRRAFVADEALLADPLGDMARRIRPGFTLLQTGMGLGVIEACIALMHEADRTHRKTNQYLADRPDDMQLALDALRARLVALAATPNDGAADYLRAVLQARLDTSELTLRATQSAMLHWGARGYLEGSAVKRRQREGDFVALITPSVRHLRRELAGMELG